VKKPFCFSFLSENSLIKKRMPKKLQLENLGLLVPGGDFLHSIILAKLRPENPNK
jgi:hypothetical protein